MRRPFIYPHRSARALPLTLAKASGALLATLALTMVVWYLRDLLVASHNAIVLELCRLVGLGEASRQITIAAGGPLDVVTVPPHPFHPTVPWLASGAAIAALAALATRFPLVRGLAAFVTTVIVLSLVGLLVDATAMQAVETFSILWTQTELLVWFVLPSLTTLLFVIVQPSLVRGLMWMVGVEAFAIVWSAIRLVVVLGFGYYTGTALLPALSFVGGLLTDALYLVTFYAWSIHVTVNLSPGR